MDKNIRKSRECWGKMQPGMIEHTIPAAGIVTNQVALIGAVEMNRNL